MIKSFSSIGLCIVSLGLAAPASAHHSAAMFDRTKQVTVVGTVKDFQWTNPHSWLHVVAPAVAGGPAIEWSIEMTSPNLLNRAGWRPATLKPGDRVTIVMAPLRDGANGGQFRSATLPDGRVMTERGPQGAPVAGTPAVS